MRILLPVLLLVAAVVATAPAQMSMVAEHNAYLTKLNFPGPDSLRPYQNDQGVRRVWVSDDLDGDGKAELLSTDYSNGGRVHVFELQANNTLELVWSSPRKYSSNANSVPRWVKTGDLDGDGQGEIIFPLGPRYTGTVQVFEWDGTDNGYGTTPSLELTADYFASALGGPAYTFRFDREEAHVGDVDGDGRDELITHNQSGGTSNNFNVYILGVTGDIVPGGLGFASWQLEGGDPAVHPENGFIGPSHWNSIPADIDGDGKVEIVNHYYDYFGFWSIDVLGPDSYRYPTPVADAATRPADVVKAFTRYTLNSGQDACAYMGIKAADVDGDGKDELVGPFYNGGTGPDAYQVAIVSLTQQDTGVYVWKDSASQFGWIARNLWTLAGKSTGSHWGFAPYDFDDDGKDEVYVGGSADYNVTRVVFKGSGSLLDPANYTPTIVFPGDAARYHFFDYYDSLGVVDTISTESPFLAGIHAGGDLNGNGKKELAVAYQSVADSITYTWYHYQDTSITPGFIKDSTRKSLNTGVITIRILEYSGSTGFEELVFDVVTPEDYVLEQNYPNPFNPSTTIRFALPVEKKISLIVYDMLGREVRSLISDQEYTKGNHAVSWDGTDNAGRPVSSGNYLYTLKYGNFSKTAKMTLLK